MRPKLSYFNALGQHWIGLTDRNTEGVWEWVTGEGVSYTNWNAGEPNNANNEDYCVINWTGNTWNDWNDASTAPFIVEFDCVNLTSGLPSGSLFPIGTTTVTYIGTDGAGNNSAPCSFTVTVNDNSAPVIICPPNITVTAAVNACSAVVNYNTPAALDNCSNCSSVVAKSGFSSLGIYNGKSYYISDMAADLNTAILACSNAGGTMATIASAAENGFIRGAANALGIGNYLIGLNDASVEGTFVWPGGMPVTYTNWNSGEPNNYGAGEDFVEVLPNGLWNDISGTGRYILEVQCHNVVRTAGPASGSSFPVGTTTITHSVTDASGNNSTCSFNVVVNPNITPVITCPSAQSLTLGISGSATLPDYRPLVALNSPCYSYTMANITQNPAPGTTINSPGTISVSMAYTNPPGTTVNCAFNVNVVSTTIVYINGSGASFSEGAGGFNIPVAIANPSGSAATSVQLAITSGSNTRVNNYSTQTITFPAGSNTTQNVNVVLSNNLLCDGNANITFSLQNITGGNSAALNGNTSFALVINDDDLQTKTWLSENAESGNISPWTQNTIANWTASDNTPCSGVYSIRHNVSGAGGESWISRSLDKRIMTGVTTTWRFNLNHYFNDPDNNNKFLYFLSSSTSSLSNIQQNGYAIGVNPASGSDPDLVKLFRVTNGAIAAEIITTSFDIDATHGEIGFVVTRNESGIWSIQIDSTGDFDNLVSQGTGSDNTYDEVSFTGLKYTFTAATAGKLSVDDILITSSGCPCTWYSVQSGNSSAPIWSQTISGTAQSAKFSEYDNFSIQPSHAVSLNNRFVAANLTVSNNSTFDTGNQDMIIFGNLTNSGAVVTGSGTLHFKGAAKQTVTSANDLTMSFINIDNDNDSVKYTGPGELIITDNIQIDQGVFHSGNKTTLKSTSSKTGAIGTIADNGSFAGKVTLQRSIPSLGNGVYGSYVGFGSPLTGQTLNDWNDDIITTGFAGSDYPPPYPFNNIYYYNEGAAGPMSNGYVPATSINDPIQTNRGYFVYLQSPVQQVDVTGDIQQHTFDAPLSFTDSSNPTDDGWNLMVNQYPSEVDFRKLAQNGSGVASYSIYDSESNNYKSYNANLNLGTASRYIPSGQSFFVKASSAGAYLHYHESYKTSQGVAFERDEEPEQAEESTPNIVLQIAAGNGSSDLSVLAFSNNATQAYDVTADVLKMNSSSNTAVEMAIPATSGQMLSINCMPFTASQIPVFVELPVAGTYTFTVNSVTNVDINSCIKIQDVLTGNIIPVEPGQILSLKTNAPYSGNRLVIHVAPAPQFEVTGTSCADLADGAIEFTQASENPVTIVAGPGNTVYSGTAAGIVGSLASGQYFMITSYENNVCPSVETSFEIQPGNQISLSIAELQYDVCNESGNGSLEIHISDASDYTYEIFDSAGNSVYTGESTGGIITAAELTHQVYTIVVSTACGTQSIQADISDPMAVTANISNAETTIDITGENNHYVIFEQSTVNADSWSWSLDNGVTSTESSFGYSFGEPGTHTLMLIASNGTCSAVDFIQVNVSEVLSVNEMSENPYITTTQNHEQITFTAHQIAGSTLVIDVYDVSGKLVHSSKQNATEGSQFRFEYDGLAGGVYSAVISCENKPLLSHKFFVEKH